jgi:hypothetical protein
MTVRKTKLDRQQKGNVLTAASWNQLLDRVERLDGGASQRTGNFDAGGVKKVGGEFAGKSVFVQLMDDIGGEDSDWCNVEAKAVFPGS